MRSYELVVVLSPALDAQQSRGLIEKVHRLIQEKGGTVTGYEEWGLRRLAYPIRHFTEGVYSLTHFQMDASRAREVDRALRLDEGVLRHLLVKQEG